MQPHTPTRLYLDFLLFLLDVLLQRGFLLPELGHLGGVGELGVGGLFFSLVSCWVEVVVAPSIWRGVGGNASDEGDMCVRV